MRRYDPPPRNNARPDESRAALVRLATLLAAEIRAQSELAVALLEALPDGIAKGVGAELVSALEFANVRVRSALARFTTDGRPRG
jgi:hypothetical protein